MLQVFQGCISSVQLHRFAEEKYIIEKHTQNAIKLFIIALRRGQKKNDKV
jgi:hypothetical protein